ncbi:MAG: hydrogenase maturation nickel metallochaperone HypA [Bacteroidales bacterium]
MHELSIAMSILQIAREEADKIAAEKVSEIEVDIGQLAGIEIESLQFVFTSACQSAMFNKCQLKLNVIPPSAKCNDCGSSFIPGALYGECPRCKSWNFTLLSGNELKVKSLLID